MIYVLKLINGCWYVGHAPQASSRIKKHVNGKGSSWTKLHPVEDVQLVMQGDRKTEREVTLDLMKLYGFTKVRGAGYTVANYPAGYPTPALDSHTLTHFLHPF